MTAQQTTQPFLFVENTNGSLARSSERSAVFDRQIQSHPMLDLHRYIPYPRASYMLPFLYSIRLTAILHSKIIPKGKRISIHLTWTHTYPVKPWPDTRASPSYEISPIVKKITSGGVTLTSNVR